PGPFRNHWHERRNRRGRDPMRELHFLRLFADHHEQNDAQQNAGSDQHFAIRQFLLKDERQHRDDRRERDTEQRALQNNAAAEPQMIGLQKENDLKAFAIERREAKQDQSPQQRSLRGFAAVSVFKQALAATIVRADPAAPINFVEEPIHDDQQYHDREQAGRRLEIERAHVVAQ